MAITIVIPLVLDTTDNLERRMVANEANGVLHGGTGLVAINEGDLILGAASNTMVTLAVGAVGKALLSDGTNPYWGDISTNDHPLTNDNAGSLAAGCPVYLKSNGNVDKARANAFTTSKVYGLAIASIATSVVGTIRTGGKLTLGTTAAWDAIKGGSGGLTPGTVYYLNPDTGAGLLTDNPSDATGNFFTQVGIAETSTTLDIRIEPPIGM